MHEDTQHVWNKLRQVKLEFSPQRHHDLLDQKDDGVLHGVVRRPVLLQGTCTCWYKATQVNLHKYSRNEIKEITPVVWNDMTTILGSILEGQIM